VLALISIDTSSARSQGSAGSEPEDDEEVTSSAAGTAADAGAAAAPGSAGSAFVAPSDPKQRLEWLPDKLQAAIGARPLLAAKAKIGVSVVDLDSGKELFAHDADRGMTLASNAKILTTVAALGTLGGGFRWRTAAFIDDGALDEATGVVNGD